MGKGGCTHGGERELNPPPFQHGKMMATARKQKPQYCSVVIKRWEEMGTPSLLRCGNGRGLLFSN
jgi:hypothetical protein